MRFSENRRLAFGVLAIVIAFSIVVQGGVAIQNERGDIEVLFMDGDMRDYMTRCALQGLMLSQTAGLYLSDGALDDYCSAGTAEALRSGGYLEAAASLSELSEQLKQAPHPNAALKALTALDEAVEKTYSAVEMLTLPEQQMRDIKLAYYDFKGGVDLARRNREEKNSYAVKAEQFNRDISGFPANVFARVLKVEPLATY